MRLKAFHNSEATYFRKKFKKFVKVTGLRLKIFLKKIFRPDSGLFDFYVTLTLPERLFCTKFFVKSQK